MRRKTFYTTVEVEADYDIEFDDLMDLIESCDEDELEQIREVIGDDNTIETKGTTTLDDIQKSELLAAASRKYTYQELLDRLDIKPFEIY